MIILEIPACFLTRDRKGEDLVWGRGVGKELHFSDPGDMDFMHKCTWKHTSELGRCPRVYDKYEQVALSTSVGYLS